MKENENRRSPLPEREAPEKKNIFKEIETDLDLSFFDRDKKRSQTELKDRKTAGRRTRRSGGGDHSRLFVVSAIALAAVVILIMVFALGGGDDRSSEEAQGTAAEISAEGTEALDAAAEETLETEEPSILRSCDIPEISMLITDYFNYRLAADAEGLYGVFGKAEDAGIDTVREMLSAQAGWIQSFDNVTVRIADGLDKDSKICFVTYDINFRRTDTAAPGIMYCYVEKRDGSYVIDETLESDKVELIDSLLAEPEVEELITEVDNSLSNALGYDSDLALIYTAFNNGEIYEESNYDPEREPEVNLFTDPSDSVLVETSAGDGSTGIEVTGAEGTDAAGAEITGSEAEAPAADAAASGEGAAAETAASAEDAAGDNGAGAADASAPSEIVIEQE